MSLKAFHIFFVIVSVLMCGITGVWGIKYHIDHGNVTFLSIGIISALVGVVLVFYGVRVAKKLKNVSYL